VVKRNNATDLVFRSDTIISYSESGKIFEGTSGIIRYDEKTNEYESAIFLGNKLGIPGLSAEWQTKPGYGGFSIKKTKIGYQGIIQVTESSALKFILDGKPGKDFVFVLNGVSTPISVTQNNDFSITIKKGKHSWQWTNVGIIPAVPVIKNAFTGPTWSEAEWYPVPGADSYSIQMSSDNEITWVDIARDQNNSIQHKWIDRWQQGACPHYFKRKGRTERSFRFISGLPVRYPPSRS
jgi:hypothetical protein